MYLFLLIELQHLKLVNRPAAGSAAPGSLPAGWQSCWLQLLAAEKDWPGKPPMGSHRSTEEALLLDLVRRKHSQNIETLLGIQCLL